MKMRIYRKWQWHRIDADEVAVGELPQYALRHSDEIQRELPNGEWETIGVDVPFVDAGEVPHPLEMARSKQADVYQRAHFNYIVGLDVQNDDGSLIRFGNKKMERGSGAVVPLVIASWSTDSDGMYMSLWLENDHLTIMLANPFHKPMRRGRISDYLMEVFEVICPGDRMEVDLSLFPKDYFDPLIDGCRTLFPRFAEGVDADNRYTYLIRALSTGNLTVILRDRTAEPEFTLPSFRLNGRFEARHSARWSAEALPELVAESDRYFQSKIAANNAVNPTRTVNGVFEEMERQCAQ